MTRTGEFDQRVAILRATEARDSVGHPVPTWTVLAQVWAKVEWLAGTEPFQGDRDYPEVTATVTIRRSNVQGLRCRPRHVIHTCARAIPPARKKK